MSICRKSYPSDVSTEEWSLVAPYLLLQREDAGQREHDLREVFNGLRYIVKTGAPWRWMPNDLPPWAAVYQQTQRWLAAGCFEALVDDLRAVLRLAAGREAEPSAAIIDSRTLRSTPESGERAGYDGGKRKKGLEDPHGRRHAGPSAGRSTSHRPAPRTAARWNGSRVPCRLLPTTPSNLPGVDQGYTGERAATAAARHGIALEGTVRNFVCGRAVEHYAAMALMKRSPKMTANWALAMVHSRGGIFHSFSDRFKIR